MTNSKELKANLRRDDNALELAALYVRALYLLNMSDRDVDCDQRHNFGATKELLISIMGENVIDDYEYGFYDRDFFSPECTAKDIDAFYSDIIKRKEEYEFENMTNEKKFENMTNDEKREIALKGTDTEAYLLYCHEIGRLYGEKPISFNAWLGGKWRTDLHKATH